MNLSNKGFLILSGLNIKQARHLKSISRQFGFKVIDEKKEANWAALLLRKSIVKELPHIND
jgi:ribosomal protein L11 methylase PrmA